MLAILISLQNRGLIKSMEFNSYTRIHHEDTEIKVVKQMPTIASNKQPTIAIITAQYCEKLAVDSMLENKETFVRYTTVGKKKKKMITPPLLKTCNLRTSSLWVSLILDGNLIVQLVSRWVI